jgi:polyferredoxin
LTGVPSVNSLKMPAIALLLVALSLPAPAATDEECHSRAECKKACAEAKQKIRTIQSRMRSGYNAVQGERMQAELRRLRAIRAKVCR